MVRILFRYGVAISLVAPVWIANVLVAAPPAPAKPIYEWKFTGPVGSQPASQHWFYDRGWDPNCPTYYSDGKQSLHIAASRRATGGRALAICVRPYPGKPGAYISGRINTHIDPAGRMKYGFFEARIKVPGGLYHAGSGAWPAFWLLGRPARWPGHIERVYGPYAIAFIYKATPSDRHGHHTHSSP